MKLFFVVAVAAIMALFAMNGTAPKHISSSGPVETVTVNEQVELGAVKWNRDLDAAKKKSAETGKPVLVLFQEVPG